MAGIKGLKALFGRQQIEQVFENFEKDIEFKTIQSLRYLGEQFVNKARLNNTYTDRTGNLRSSIGYIVLKNGQLIDENFPSKSTGSAKGLNVAKEVSGQYPEGFVLIGVAGMEYAAYVEAKNFDVITGSAPTSADFKSLINEINN